MVVYLPKFVAVLAILLWIIGGVAGTNHDT